MYVPPAPVTAVALAVGYGVAVFFLPGGAGAVLVGAGAVEVGAGTVAVGGTAVLVAVGTVVGGGGGGETGVGTNVGGAGGVTVLADANVCVTGVWIAPARASAPAAMGTDTMMVKRLFIQDSLRVSLRSGRLDAAQMV